MSAILPPSERVWWKQPLDRVELIWIVIALVWCLIMFFMMPYWHVYGKQNLANEAFRTTPAEFLKKTEAMVAQYKVREEGAEIQITYRGEVVALLVPVARPPDPEEPQAWAALDHLAAEIGARWPEGISAAEAVSEGRR